MTIARLVLVALASLRVIRFITSDSLGEWTLVAPAKRWAWRHERPALISDAAAEVDPNIARDKVATTPPWSWGWRSKLVKGLDCPHCVGFWVGLLALVIEAATSRAPLARRIWTILMAPFALSYVTGHVSSRLDNS